MTLFPDLATESRSDQALIQIAPFYVFVVTVKYNVPVAANYREPQGLEGSNSSD
jgi:hypothetical protein